MMKSLIMLSLFGSILPLAFVLNPVFATKTCDFPAIFNFGDGNSDTGGGFATGFFGSPPFYGESFFNLSGRGSDGLLMIDFIATSLGKPFLSAYLDSLGSNFSYGVNFAQILAPIGLPKLILPVATTPFAFSPFFLGVQFSQFQQFINRSQKVRKEGGVFKGLMPKSEYFSKGLYTIDIGQNDLVQGLFTNMSVDEIKESIPDIINSLSTILKNIYNLGARTFWIHNTGPLGCLPYILTLVPNQVGETDSVGCSKPVNELAQFFNYILKEAVDQLRIDLPLAAITYVDVYSAKYSLYLEPEKYGFELPLVACCGLGGPYNFGNVTCGYTAIVNGNPVLVSPCKDPSKRISWDGIQYSQAADKINFEKISTGEFSDPPNSLKMACQKMKPNLNTRAMNIMGIYEQVTFV